MYYRTTQPELEAELQAIDAVQVGCWLPGCVSE